VPAEARVNLLARHALRRAFAHVSTASIDTSLKSSRAFCCCYSRWISRRTRHVGLIGFSVERGISTTAHVAAPPHREPPREPRPRRSPHGATTRILDGRLTSPTSARREHRSECSRGSPPERPLAYVSQPPCAHLVRLGHSGMPHVARVSRVDVSARDAHVAHVTPRIPVVGRLTWLTLQKKTAVSGLRRRCADACTDEPC